MEETDNNKGVSIDALRIKFTTKVKNMAYSIHGVGAIKKTFKDSGISQNSWQRLLKGDKNYRIDSILQFLDNNGYELVIQEKKKVDHE